VSVYSRVNAYTEDVLVVLCQCARVDHVAPRSSLAWVDIDDGNDASCPGLYRDGTSEVEFVLYRSL
jgi:hypothetical protein